MTGLGTHILLDLYGCNPGRLNDLEFLRQMSLEGVRRSGATIIGDSFKQFQPQGVSGVVIIAESHLTLHSWPEYSYLAMDYFTCGDRIQIDDAVGYFEQALSPERVQSSRHFRGVELKSIFNPLVKATVEPFSPDWFTEYHWDPKQPDKLLLGYRYAVAQELTRTRSEYQDILVVDNPVYGRMLVLDGFVNTTEKDEYVYHEMLAHVPLVLHGCAQRVLIIGGGDGGLLREVLRHPGIEHVDMVEIDAKVVEVARAHLPSVGSGFDDSRIQLHFEDGSHFVQDKQNLYDVILVDSTDPMGPGTALYQSGFYENCRRALHDGGVFAAQGLSPWLQENEQVAMFSTLMDVWQTVRPYLATVPTYPGGLWTFALAADREVMPESFSENYAGDISRACRYYNAAIHRSAFCLPNFLKKRFKQCAPYRH
jgi:spermidine synthase